MTKTHTKQSGFTLVELAIVMIIIGLLIGGILKGQELIANAQTTATIAKIKGIDGAISTFRDKYSAMPGDMLTPGTRIANCTAAPCVPAPAGDGDGRIEGGVPSAVPAGERLAAFPQLAAADLISGIEINTVDPTFGGNYPEADLGGGFWVGHSPSGATGIAAIAGRSGHYLTYSDDPAAAVVAAAPNGIEPVQAGKIDRKIDDGNPQTGDALSTGSACTVGVGAAATYDEDNNAGNCVMFIRVQS